MLFDRSIICIAVEVMIGISCENTRLITQSICKAMEWRPSHILVGDFNFKEIDWEGIRGREPASHGTYTV